MPNNIQPTYKYIYIYCNLIESLCKIKRHEHTNTFINTHTTSFLYETGTFYGRRGWFVMVASNKKSPGFIFHTNDIK